MENTDIREKLRASEQRETLLDDSKARLEAELSASKKNSSEKHMEIEVSTARERWLFISLPFPTIAKFH